MKRALFFLLLAGCVQSTGGALVSFHAQARGDGVTTFDTASGYRVGLTTAKLFVGALYLNQSNPGAHTLETSCVLPGIYSGEVRGGLTVDALSAAPQPFAVDGVGTADVSSAAELWLSSGDVDLAEDPTVILQLEGTATKAGATRPFRASVHIGQNRAEPPRDSALPGSNPICKQRIVTPIPTDFRLAEGGTVGLVVHPARWLDGVDFAQAQDDGSGGWLIPDDGSSAPAVALYQALRAAKGPYELTWSAP